MPLDKAFVKSLHPALSDVVPHGAAVRIAREIGRSELTVRNAINGASTNTLAVREAIKSILRRAAKAEELLGQVPGEILEELRSEMQGEERKG